MKKRSWFLKLISVFFILGTVISTTILNTQAAVGAPATIVTGDSYYLEGYVAGTKFGVKTLESGGYAYCLDITKQTPQRTVMYLSGEKDAGLAYILEMGYPNKSFTGNKNYDYYITQSAVWWYLDTTTGSHNLSSDFKNNGSDPHNLRPHIQKLVNGAIEAKKNGYVKPKLGFSTTSTTLTLSTDRKYYESAAIQVTGTNVSAPVKVSISGAPSNTVLVNASGQVQTEYSVGSSFKVRVPVSSVENLSNTITLTARSTGSVKKAYEYKPKDNAVQNVVPMTLYPETTNLTAAIKVTLDTSKVTILKIDADTKKPLAGATIVLKDATGKVITSWVSTTKAHVIQNLKDGTYTIEEAEAPKGYKKASGKATFTISKEKRSFTINISNKAIAKNVQIVKIDKDTQLPLAGAHLRVTNANGEVIADFVSTNEPYVLQNIKDGTYYVEEIEAPKGYIKADGKYTFTISDGTPTAQVFVENRKEEVLQEVPNTKNNTSILPPILGFLLITSGIGFVYYNGKKKYE